MAVLLADGAGATVLEHDPTAPTCCRSCWRRRIGRGLLTCQHEGYFQMNGKEVFRRAVRVVVESSRRPGRTPT